MSKLVLLCFILAASMSALAGDSKKDVRDVTGCLSQGDSAKEFVLKGSDGSTWEVKSDKVTLAEHVGHTVTATGVVSNAAMHNMKEKTKEEVAPTVDSGWRRARCRSFSLIRRRSIAAPRTTAVRLSFQVRGNEGAGGWNN